MCNGLCIGLVENDGLGEVAGPGEYGECRTDSSRAVGTYIYRSPGALGSVRDRLVLYMRVPSWLLLSVLSLNWFPFFRLETASSLPRFNHDGVGRERAECPGRLQRPALSAMARSWQSRLSTKHNPQ